MPPDPSPRGAINTGLLMLSRRELSTSQLRTRLLAKGFPPASVDAALAHLQASHALDDRRAARARARHDVAIHRRGRARVLRQVRAMGVDADAARDAVSAAFEDVDESRLLAEALERRLKGSPFPTELRDVRRLQAWLLRQGFEPDAIRRALGRRRGAGDD
jgi:SOS response regulatory protein OraA/RecX